MALYVNQRDFFLRAFLDFPPLSHGDTHLCSVHMLILETSVRFNVHTKWPHVYLHGHTIHELGTLRNPSQLVQVFLAAGRLVCVPDREPREEEWEAEERRRLLAASLLSSTASWLGRSSRGLSTSTVRSSTRRETQDRNDKQPCLWSRSQKIAFSSFTFTSLFVVELVWNLMNRSWKSPNTTEKKPKNILLKKMVRFQYDTTFLWKSMNESELWLHFHSRVCGIPTQTDNEADLKVLSQFFFWPNLIPGHTVLISIIKPVVINYNILNAILLSYICLF